MVNEVVDAVTIGGSLTGWTVISTSIKVDRGGCPRSLSWSDTTMVPLQSAGGEMERLWEIALLTSVGVPMNDSCHGDGVLVVF